MTYPLMLLWLLILAVSSTDEAPLQGTHWDLASIDAYDGPDISATGGVTIIFLDDRNEFKGCTGCNSYRGRYRTEGSLFRIVDLSWTEAGCPTQELFEQEQLLQQVLSDAYEFILEDSQLTITATDGQALMFSP